MMETEEQKLLNSSNSSITALVPGGVVTTQNISTVIRPKGNSNSLQFVKIQTPELSKKAVEQIRIADETKISKEKIKEVEEEWQNNLLNWKSKRRQQLSHSVDYDPDPASDNNNDCGTRKVKTFAEMIEQRAKSGNRLSFHLQRYAGTDEDEDSSEKHSDNHDLSNVRDEEDGSCSSGSSSVESEDQQSTEPVDRTSLAQQAKPTPPIVEQAPSPPVKQPAHSPPAKNVLSQPPKQALLPPVKQAPSPPVKQIVQRAPSPVKWVVSSPPLETTVPPPVIPEPQKLASKPSPLPVKQTTARQAPSPVRRIELPPPPLEMIPPPVAPKPQTLLNKQSPTPIKITNVRRAPSPARIIEPPQQPLEAIPPPVLPQTSSSINKQSPLPLKSTTTRQPAPQPSKLPSVKQTGSLAPPPPPILSISGKKRCSSCKEELGRGAAAFVVESLSLVYHTNCFRCSVCHMTLSNGFQGVDVRVHAGQLHCHNCYSKDGLSYSRV